MNTLTVTTLGTASLGSFFVPPATEKSRNVRVSSTAISQNHNIKMYFWGFWLTCEIHEAYQGKHEKLICWVCPLPDADNLWTEETWENWFFNKNQQSAKSESFSQRKSGNLLEKAEEQQVLLTAFVLQMKVVFMSSSSLSGRHFKWSWLIPLLVVIIEKCYSRSYWSWKEVNDGRNG